MSHFGLLNLQQALGHHVAARRRSGRAAGQAGQSRPRRHARSAGHRRAGRRHWPGHAAGRVRAADAEAISGHVSAWAAPARPRTSKATSPCSTDAPFRRSSELAAGRGRGWSAKFCSGPRRFRRLKVAGRRAYALARAGQSVELAPRPIQVHRLEITALRISRAGLEIDCGSGTYVRSLGRDLAELAGTAAVMSALVRTAIGPFLLDRARSTGRAFRATTSANACFRPRWPCEG